MVLGNAKEGTLKKKYMDAIDGSVVYGPVGIRDWCGRSYLTEKSFALTRGQV